MCLGMMLCYTYAPRPNYQGQGHLFTCNVHLICNTNSLKLLFFSLFLFNPIMDFDTLSQLCVFGDDALLHIPPHVQIAKVKVIYLLVMFT